MRAAAAQVATAAPALLTSVTATPRADHSVDVTWRVSTSGQPTEFVYLWPWSSTGSPGRMVQVNADEPSKTFHVGTGGMLFLAAAANSSGAAPWIASSVIDVPAGCATADVCVNVDGAGATKNMQPAQGFNAAPRSSDGTTLSNAALTNALRPKNWRVGSLQFSKDAATFGGSRSLFISSLWWSATGAWNGGYAALPWNDWTYFRSFMTESVRSAKATGTAPEYWDLANEPDLFSYSEYFSPSQRATATPANVLQMLLVEYQAIKAADPFAKIVAPSDTAYVDGVNAPTDAINMRTFLAFAAANNMKIDAVSWHENDDDPRYQDATFAPALLTDHVQRFKRLVAKYPAVGNPLVFINEYGHQMSHLMPGWTVGYFAQLDSNAVAQGARSCWSAFECGDPSLGGILAPTGSTWQGTTPAYWAHRLYADMDGAARMATNSSMTWRFSGTSTRSDASKTIRVLLGQHWGCAPASGNPWCANAFDPGAMTASVSVAWPYSGTSVDVKVSRIAAGVAPTAAPPAVTTTVTVTGGRVAVPLSGIGDGDAISVVLTPHV